MLICDVLWFYKYRCCTAYKSRRNVTSKASISFHKQQLIQSAEQEASLLNHSDRNKRYKKIFFKSVTEAKTQRSQCICCGESFLHGENQGRVDTVLAKFSKWSLRRPVSCERRREAVLREAEGHMKVKSQEMMRPVNTFLRVGASFQLALLWISGVKTGERPPKNTSTPPLSNILLCGWVSPFPTENRCSTTFELPTMSVWPSSEYSL